MSRSAKVYIKGIYAGLLTEIDREHYSFCYDTDYYNNPQLPAVSLTMPKTQQEYTSSYLFPVFFNMTSEGDNRIIQARNLHIDEEDDFGILLATASYGSAQGSRSFHDRSRSRLPPSKNPSRP